MMGGTIQASTTTFYLIPLKPWCTNTYGLPIGLDSLEQRRHNLAALLLVEVDHLLANSGDV